MSQSNGNDAFTSNPGFFSVGVTAPPALNRSPSASGTSAHALDAMDVDSDVHPFGTAQDALGPTVMTASPDETAQSLDPVAAPSPDPANRGRTSSKRSTAKTPAKTSRASKRPASSPADLASTAASPAGEPATKRAKMSKAPDTLSKGQAWIDPDNPPPTPLLEQAPDITLDRRSRRSAPVSYNENTLSAAAARLAAAGSPAPKPSARARVRAAASAQADVHQHDEPSGVEPKPARKSRASGTKAKGKAKAASAEPKEARVDRSDHQQQSGEVDQDANGKEDVMDVDHGVGQGTDESTAQGTPARSKPKSRSSKKSNATSHRTAKQNSKQHGKSKSSSSAAASAASAAPTRRTRRSISAAPSYAESATEDESEFVDVTESSPALSRPRNRQTRTWASAPLDVVEDLIPLPSVPPAKTYGRRASKTAGSSRASSTASLAEPVHDGRTQGKPSLPNEKPSRTVPSMMHGTSESELSDLSDDEEMAGVAMPLETIQERTSQQPVEGRMETTLSRHSRNKQVRDANGPSSPTAASPSSRSTRSASRRVSLTAPPVLADAAADLSRAHARIETLQAQLADLEAELTALRSASNQHEQLVADLDAKRAELDHLRTELHDTQADAAQKARHIEAYQEEVDKLTADVLSMKASLADVEQQLDLVTRQRDEYDARLTQAETQLAKRTRGGGAYEFERSPVTVSNGLSGFKQTLSAFCRAVLVAPVNKGRQAKEVFPKMVRVMREALVEGAAGGLGFVPGTPAHDGFTWLAATAEGVQAVSAMGNPIAGVSVSTQAHVDLTAADPCVWPAFDIRISQAVSVLSAITLHTLYAVFADNPVDRTLRHSSHTLAESLPYGGGTQGTLDAAWAELRANAATASLAAAEVYYHKADPKAPGPPRHVQKLDMDQVVEDPHWAEFFVRARDVLEQAYARVGVQLGMPVADGGDDAAGLRARLDVLVRRFAVLWFMVPAIDPNWVVTFFSSGVRAPVAEKFMPETVLEVENGPSEDDEDLAALLVLATAIPAVLVKDQEIVISPASGIRVVVPKELVESADEQGGQDPEGQPEAATVPDSETNKDDSGSDIELLDVDETDYSSIQQPDDDGDGDGDVTMAEAQDRDDDVQTATGSDFSLASDLQLADRLLEQVQSPMITSGSFSSPPRGASAALDAIIGGSAAGVPTGAASMPSGDVSDGDLLLSFAASAALRGPAGIPSHPLGGLMPPPLSASIPAPAPPTATVTSPNRRTSFIGSLGSSFMSYVTGSPSAPHQNNGSSSSQ